MRDIPNIMLTFEVSFNAHCEVRSFVISEKRNERRLSGAFFMPLRQHFTPKACPHDYLIVNARVHNL